MDPEQLAGALKVAVDQAASRHRLSPDRWTTIERRARWQQWRRAITAAVASMAVVAVAVAAAQFGFRPARPAPLSPGPEQLAVLGRTRLPGAGLGMATGYGAVWVPATGVTYQVDESTGAIVRKIVTPGVFPSGCGSGVAAGFGSVWVSYGCRGVYRINARTGRLTASIRVARAGDTVTVADGLVWVMTTDGDLLRIDPHTDAMTGAPIGVGYGRWMIVPAAGSLWVTSFGSGSGSVSRVNPASGQVRQVGSISDVAAAGAGSLWTSRVQRVNPATGKVQALIALPVLGAADVAFWKSQVWVLILRKGLAVVRIEPALNRVVGPATRLPSPSAPGATGGPASLVSGPAGLWVIDHDSGLLYRLGMRNAMIPANRHLR
jgi:hypothetical protein